MSSLLVFMLLGDVPVLAGEVEVLHLEVIPGSQYNFLGLHHSLGQEGHPDVICMLSLLNMSTFASNAAVA